MTRVFLAAGVAALAIAAPASAGPHGHGGNQPAFQKHGGGGGGQHAQRAERRGGGGSSHASAPRVQRSQHAQRAERREARPQRTERAHTRVAERRSRPQHAERAQTRRVAAQRHQARPQHAERAQSRVAERHQARPQHVQRAQNRPTHQMQAHGNRAQQRVAMRQQMRGNHANQSQRVAMRQQVRAERHNGARSLLAERRSLRPDRIADNGTFRTSRFASLLDNRRTRVIAPAQAVRFVGQPLNRVNNYVTLAALPASVSYLYPATNDYYYRYGDGYLYQIDRGSSLIAALIPLLAGGYLPGTYLPSAYMSSYVPAYYGLSSFYPASYSYGYGAAYGYGTANLCNRYAYGVVYQVDCFNGMVENVIPTYAGGYGVGQMLPSAYSYYNLPMQYRDMYYPTADYSYWYAPGAIYQYDTSSSLITSVAALMTPGFSIGQPMPMGYNMYNVPMAYRATYYDTPNAWYRYNNGYIYQVDPSSMLVTAIVASLLT